MQREIAEVGGSATVHVCDIREEEVVKKTVADVLAAHGRIDGLVSQCRAGSFPAAQGHLCQGWGRGRAQQPDRLLPHEPRGLQPVDGGQRRRDRQHAGRHLDGHAGMGHSRRLARRHPQLHRDRRHRMGAGARQRGGAGHHRLQRAGHLLGGGRSASASVSKQIPAGRYGTESEIAAGIVYLLPAAGFISGIALRIDGAVPHAKRIWGKTGNGGRTRAFNAFTSPPIPGAEHLEDQF